MSSFELNLSGEFFTFRFVALASNREGKVKKKNLRKAINLQSEIKHFKYQIILKGVITR